MLAEEVACLPYALGKRQKKKKQTKHFQFFTNVQFSSTSSPNLTSIMLFPSLIFKTIRLDKHQIHVAAFNIGHNCIEKSSKISNLSWQRNLLGLILPSQMAAKSSYCAILS